MATEEAYMLNRSQEESIRLDAQHHFMRQLAHGSLVQSSIPRSNLRAIADVATGTGIWLREAAQELNTSKEEIDFTGFDISAQQFPKDDIHGVNFVVHSVVEPFPPEYHEKFDLVHVRLLSYALRAQDLENSVRNIIQLLQPGGYLQWQEVDVIDSWAVPETPNARSTVAYIISERVARGLTPAFESLSQDPRTLLIVSSITTPLVKTIQSFSTPILAGQVSPICWNGDLMRILHLDTISTMNHPSPVVQAGKKHAIKSSALVLLQAGMSRKEIRAAQTQSSTSSLEAQELTEDVEARKRLLDAWNQGTDPACSDWNFAMTSIVTRKTLVMNEHQAWMTAKY